MDNHERLKKAWIARKLNGNAAPWNKGKKTGKLSKEHRAKISKALVGVVHTPEALLKQTETKRKNGTMVLPVKKGGHHTWGSKISKSLKGNKNSGKGKSHWNWHGGITEISKKIRNSKRYKRWRDAVFKRDNWTCQICKKLGCYVEADHIKAFSLYPKLRFRVSNGRTLCRKCHKKYGWQLFKDANPRIKLTRTPKLL